MRSIRLAGAAPRLAAIVALGLLSASVSARQQDATAVVAGRMHAYLARYRETLGSLIARERYEQSVPTVASPARSFPAVSLKTELLISDFVFAPAPDGSTWAGLRIVRSVDGRAVPDPDARIAMLLNAHDAAERNRTRALLEESARENLGDMRTTNTPVLALDLLDARYANRFEVTMTDARCDGRDCVSLRFDEVQSPTIVRQPDGGDMNAVVTALVDRSTGAIHRTDVELMPPQLGMKPVTARVTFERDRRLGMLVPHEMRETFASMNGRGEGRATYSDYRRFETGVTIR